MAVVEVRHLKNNLKNMDPKTHKLVFVVEDLPTKDKKSLAIVSVDVHYFRDSKLKVKYHALLSEYNQRLANTKQKASTQELEEIAIEMKKCLTIGSAQMSLDSNKEFVRCVKSLTSQVIQLKEEDLDKK